MNEGRVCKYVGMRKLNLSKGKKNQGCSRQRNEEIGVNTQERIKGRVVKEEIWGKERVLL
jgi:hypothetical protein